MLINQLPQLAVDEVETHERFDAKMPMSKNVGIKNCKNLAEASIFYK